MNKFLIDTSILVSILRKKIDESFLERLKGEIGTSAVCLAELYEGVFRSKEQSKVKKALDHLIKKFNFISLVGIKEAQEFGRIRAELKTKGKIIEDMDIFIAASCLTGKFTLVTFNIVHFKRIKGLKIYKFKKS